MSMMFGIISDGDVYLAADRRGSYYNPKTKESGVIGDVESKITVLDKHTVIAATGVCFYTDPIQKIAPLLWERAGGNINKFRIEIKNKYNEISRRKNIIPQSILNDKNFDKSFCANLIVAHYDVARNKPVLYGLNDYDDFNEVTYQEQEFGTIGTSALKNEIMWPLIENIKASSAADFIRCAFIVCSFLEPAIGDNPEIYKINQEGVQKI